MSELENPSSNAGVKITEISLRYAEQAVELENIDPEDVLKGPLVKNFNVLQNPV